MKKLFLLVSILFCFYLSNAQQYCITGRFDTTNVFSPSEIDSSIVVFGRNMRTSASFGSSSEGDSIDLYTTIYYPNMTIDPLKKRPLVMLIHGGSFSSGARENMTSEVKYFAAKGYVCATIDYRLGWSDSLQYCKGDNKLHIDAIYRAVQDAKAALRYLSANSATYHIDSTEIFIGGTSAGAFTALAVVFTTEEYFNFLKPGISDTLGHLNSSSNNLTDPYFIKGILSYKGAIFDSSIINSENMIPAIFLHGTADPYYPYYSGNAYNCSNYFTLDGSGSLSKRLRNLGECYELNYKINGDHGEIYPANYTLGRRALFMKRLLCNECDQIIVENQNIINEGNKIIADVKVYPNPVLNNLIVTGVDNTYRYEIYNVSSQIIKSDWFIDNSINFTELAGGFYILTVFDKENKIIIKTKIIK